MYDRVRPGPDQKVIGCRWVFVRKRNDKGIVVRHRARLVAKGFQQCPGWDYTEVYNPVVTFTLVRIAFMVLVVLGGWLHNHLDVKCAYLYGTLDKPIHMEVPAGVKGQPGEAWLLKKALYGLHQAGRCWWGTLQEQLLRNGFVPFESCECVYWYERKALVMVYVDDILIFAKDRQTLTDVQRKLTGIFQMTDLGPTTTFLGIQIQENSRLGTVCMNQEPYIRELSRRMDMIPVRGAREPMKVGAVYSRQLLGEATEDLPYPYRSLIGSLLYIARMTRPDLLIAVNTLAKYTSKPTLLAWTHAEHLMNYVRQTCSKSMVLSRRFADGIRGFSDASWGSDVDTSYSVSGLLVLIGNSPIIWRSARQTIIAQSTMEAETMALVEMVKELVWLDEILQELKPVMPKEFGRIEVLIDNESAMFAIKNAVENGSTKHFTRKLRFVRDHYSKGLFSLRHVSTNRNLADALTKPLSASKLDTLTPYLSDCRDSSKF